jgi:hypothetical protein
MGNKRLASFVLGCVLLIGSGISSVYAQQSKAPWKSPWQEQPNANLQTLINDGYEMVGTGIVVAGRDSVEVIYLKKGKSLYRCSTIQQHRSAQHGCEMLVSPEKNQ